MKRLVAAAIATLMAFALMACSDGDAAQPAASSSTQASQASKPPMPEEDVVKSFEGDWKSDDGTTLVVWVEGDHFGCHILQKDSNSTGTEWWYSCSYDGESLVDDGTGEKNLVKFGKDGSVTSRENVYKDGTASFTFDKDDILVWIDFKEYPGNGMVGFWQPE